MIEKTSYILSKFPNKDPNSRGQIHTTCPFHDDNTSSFSINVEEGVFICGSSHCGIRGAFPLFYKLMENIDSWVEVFEDLKSKDPNYDLNEFFSADKGPRVSSIIINPFPEPPGIEPLGDIQFLQDRGITPEVCQRYGLVYGREGRHSGISIRSSIVAPVWDVDSVYKTFQVRYLSPNSPTRWLNPVGSPIQELLYGGHAIDPYAEFLWVVEGASDVWRMSTFGVQSVGLNTKEASPSQFNKIKSVCDTFKCQPVICLDGDAAVAPSAYEMSCNDILYINLAAFGFQPKIVTLNYSEDPGSLSYDRFLELQETL